MANTLYDSGRQKILEGSINWNADTIKVALVDTGTYTFSNTHTMYSNITGVVGTPAAITGKTTTTPGLGVVDASDTTLPTITGVTVEALVLYKDSGTASTSPLIAYIDSATGLPVTPNGGDITIQWANSGNYIFKI